jgi:hypothetical protein
MCDHLSQVLGYPASATSIANKSQGYTRANIKGTIIDLLHSKPDFNPQQILMANSSSGGSCDGCHIRISFG